MRELEIELRQDVPNIQSEVNQGLANRKFHVHWTMCFQFILLQVAQYIYYM